MSGYPGYHTGFETFDLVDKIYDPEFKVFISFFTKNSSLKVKLAAQVFRACAQLNLRLTLQLAESPLLPLKMEPYAKVNFTTNQGQSFYFESGDGGRRGILGEFRGFEPSEAIGNCHNPLGGGCLGIQVHIPHPTGWDSHPHQNSIIPNRSTSLHQN